MKCIKYCVALLGLLMGTSSCDSFFDKPTNVQDLDYVFGNGSTTLSWLAHGYSLIPEPADDDPDQLGRLCAGLVGVLLPV